MYLTGKDCNGGMHRRYCIYIHNSSHDTNKFNFQEDQKREMVKTESVHTRYSMCPIVSSSAHQS